MAQGTVFDLFHKRPFLLYSKMTILPIPISFILLGINQMAQVKNLRHVMVVSRGVQVGNLRHVGGTQDKKNRPENRTVLKSTLIRN
jgi:hypothetical protein